MSDGDDERRPDNGGDNGDTTSQENGEADSNGNGNGDDGAGGCGNDDDDEDDSEGYYLEPVSGGVNITEKIAEANKKLFEESEEDSGTGEVRTRKVQFSEDLVNFEPDYEGSEAGTAVEEEDDDGTGDRLKLIPEVPDDDVEERFENGEDDVEEEVEETLSKLLMSGKDDDSDKDVEENEDDDDDDRADEITEEIHVEADSNLFGKGDSYEEERSKLLLILMPAEQSSSCESVIGEDDVPGQDTCQVRRAADPTSEPETKPAKPKMARPKSANGFRLKRSCQVSKISPNLNYTSNMGRTSWQSGPAIRTKSGKSDLGTEAKGRVGDKHRHSDKSQKSVKKVNIGRLDDHALRQGTETRLKRCESRPKSSVSARGKAREDGRPKTAPMKRTCCVIKSDLPRYNGLRSEYGLSAEQLQERKQRTLQLKHQKKQTKLRERQDELRRRHQAEETFQRWLSGKCKKDSGPRKWARGPPRPDTLSRSDVYIQTHASYAANRNVPYSVDYGIGHGKPGRLRGDAKPKSAIVLERMFDKVSPHYKRCFNIYVGSRK